MIEVVAKRFFGSMVVRTSSESVVFGHTLIISDALGAVTNFSKASLAKQVIQIKQSLSLL
jgi:hypothetical protein